MDYSNKIDSINIFLIIISLTLAIVFPFELFLWSYAILGPLHYVTEINWLHSKNYFIKHKKFIWITILTTFLFTIPMVLNMNQYTLELLQRKHSIYKIYYLIYPYNVFLLIFTFLFSIALVYTKKIKPTLIFIFISLVLSFLIYQSEDVKFYIITFLPTLIHVYIFTLFFMLYGALKENSKLGFVSVLILALTPFIVYLLPESLLINDIALISQERLKESNFHLIIEKINEIFFRDKFVGLNSPNAVKIQIFIAFAYTYHYLNWFSKTTKIGWYKSISKQKLIILIAFWLLSSGLYFYNYKLGLIVLFILSFLHVSLEFPLNYISIKEIVLFIKRRFTS